MTPDRKTRAARERIRAEFADEYDAGARAGFTKSSRYPQGFHSWPPERRDAFYAGYNAGRCDRLNTNDLRNG
jgi:hypothetical protein